MRLRLACILFFLVALAAPASAQITTVTGTVTDPNGIPYAGGTIKAQLTAPAATVTINNAAQCAGGGFGSAPCQVPIQGTVGPISLDTNGSFTLNLYDNTQITPAATQWIFTVGITPGIPPPLGFGGQSFTVQLTISGSSQSISTNLSTAAPALSRTFSGGSGACGTLAANQILFGTAPTTCAVSPNFTWTNSAKALLAGDLTASFDAFTQGFLSGRFDKRFSFRSLNDSANHFASLGVVAQDNSSTQNFQAFQAVLEANLAGNNPNLISGGSFELYTNNATGGYTGTGSTGPNTLFISNQLDSNVNVAGEQSGIIANVSNFGTTNTVAKAVGFHSSIGNAGTMTEADNFLSDVPQIATVGVTKWVGFHALSPGGVGTTNYGFLAEDAGTAAGAFAFASLGLTPSSFGGRVIENQFFDLATIAAPANPAAGFDRFFANTATGLLNCLTSGGADCLIPSTVVKTNQSNTYTAGTQDFTGAAATKVTTQAAADNSTNAASTAFVTTAVTNAINGVNPAVAVQAATAAVLPNTPTYLNGVGGIGATLTAGVTNTALVVDGYTVLLNDRVLVKNQAAPAQNGVYFQSTLATIGVAWVLTRALDYDQPSDMNNTGAIPVVNGTANASTSWVQTSKVTTVGTDPVTFTQFTLSPTTLVTAAAPLANKGVVIGQGGQAVAAIDFPDVKMVPAANCNNTTAGPGWSIGSGGTATCRAGTNNLGGFISISDTSTTFATFQIAVPEDWDSAQNPYIRFQLASTDAVNAHTIIPEINVACYKGDGSTTDDVAANGFHSLSTVTLNGNANRFWSSSNVQMNSTDVTGCVAGALMQITVGRATDTATNAEFYSATVTFPRLIVVQAN